MSAIQSLPDANIRSGTYYIARTECRCWHCGLSGGVLALAVPPQHETLHADTPIADLWQRSLAPAFLFFVECVTFDVQRRLRELSPCFRLTQDAVSSNSNWLNHCGRCGKQLGDYELHCEPEGAFMPTSEAAAAGIELVQIHEPLETTANGYAFEPEFFRFMRKS
jgi:hypothetical protein